VHWLNLFAKFSVTERTAGLDLAEQCTTGLQAVVSYTTSACHHHDGRRS